MDEERPNEPQAKSEAQTSGEGGENAWERLNGKLNALDEQLAALETAARRNRNAKWVVMALILVVLAGYGLLLYGTVKAFDTDVLVTELTNRLDRLLPHLSTHLTRALVAVAPDYQKALEAEAQKQLPVLAKRLPEERDKLLDEVGPRVHKRLEIGLKGVAKKHEKKLIEFFPELKDDHKRQIVAEHLQHAIEIATAELLHDRLTKCVDAIMRVNETVDRFKPAHIRERDGRLRDQMADVYKSFLADPTGHGK